MAVQQPKISYTFVDQSGEYSSSGFYVSGLVDLSTGGAQTIFNTNFASAYAQIAEGDVRKIISSQDDLYALAIDAGDGNREDKWLVQYTDTVTAKAYTVTLPCRKPLATEPLTDVLPVASYPLFKAWFEANCVSPDDNPVTIFAIRLVGRNI